MAIERRTFLKSIFTSSALLASATPVYVSAGQDRRQFEFPSVPATVLVHTGTSLDDVFLQGVEAACHADKCIPLRTMELVSQGLTDPLFLQQIFTSLKGSRLLGLMEDAPFALFQAIARTHGVRFLSIGQHGWGNTGEYDSRHQMITVSQCQGVSSVLAASLAADNQGYVISETSLGSVQKDERVNQAPPLTSTGHWAAITGEALAKISTGDWQPARAGKFQAKQHTSRYGNSGSLVSFLIEI